MAEDTLLISNAGKYSNPQLRIGLLRIFALTGIVSIGLFLTKSNFKTIRKDNLAAIKNLISLKLRI
jgi:hypothetical protein